MDHEYLAPINTKVGGPLDPHDTFDRANVIVARSWLILDPQRSLHIMQEDYDKAEFYLMQVLEDLDMYHGVVA